MSNEKKLALSKAEGLIPELRFPEFKKEGEWDEKSLDDLCELITKGTTPTTLGFSYTVTGVNFIKIESILDGNINLEKAAFISTECNEAFKRSQLKENDILFSIAGALGVVTTVSKEVLPANTNQALSIIRLKNVNLKDYVKAYLKSNIISEEINKIKAGAAQLNISLGQIANFNILIPKNLKEQQKIASCLSSLDEVISAHSQKLDLLKDHKKGLMQNLFPQEGEKVPKYRFKAFEKDGAWIFEPFHKIYSFLVTNSFSREFLNYENGIVKNIHYGDIHTKFSTLFDITKERVPFINLNLSIEKIREECYCIVGDMIFADASEDLNDVGKSIEIVNLNGEKLLSGLHTLMARQIEKKLEIGFGGHLFKTNGIKKQIQKEAQGAKVLGISSTRILNILIYYPLNQKEQQKIATCLSSLDELITAQTEKIAQLKLHKKGLMQGLFPKIND
jgi:type I restriction enzyme, S subunit